MIDIKHLSYTYPNTDRPALSDVSLHIPVGAFVLVSGTSGSGKSTLLRALNGLVPHFYGGRFSGRVVVDGLDTRQAAPRTLASTIGFVFQDPAAQFVVQTVEDEIAFGLENLAVPPEQMPERIAEALAGVGALHLRKRQTQSLSGGEAQRVAVACALALRPRVLVLDEPASQLDPPGAEGLFDVLARLHQNGMTIIVAEHRLARLLSMATHLLVLRRDEMPLLGPPAEVIAQSPLRPPFIEAAIRLGWQPLPLSLAEAQQRATRCQPSIMPPLEIGETTIDINGLSAGYEGRRVLDGVDLTLHRGECVGLMGANGSGKSTLLKTLAGILKPMAGHILWQGEDITAQRIDQRAQHIAYVPQDPNTVLFADTLLDELQFTLDGLHLPGVMEPGEFLAHLKLDAYASRYPRDLSGGERQRAALAAMLIADRPILLLDEPTLGLDYEQRDILVNLLQDWKRQGRAILLATHDVELAAQVADQVVILDDGRVQIAGPARDVLSRTPGYQTQLAQVFGLLTLNELL